MRLNRGETTVPVSESPGDAPPAVVYRIVQRLETYGLTRYDYQLHDTLNPSALEALIASADPHLQISFQVKGFWATVLGDGTVDVHPP